MVNGWGENRLWVEEIKFGGVWIGIGIYLCFFKCVNFGVLCDFFKNFWVILNIIKRGLVVIFLMVCSCVGRLWCRVFFKFMKRLVKVFLRKNSWLFLSNLVKI